MFVRVRPLFLLAFAALACTATSLVHAESCTIAQPHPLTEEQQAVIRGDLPRAENLYRQKIAQRPKDPKLTAGLVRTLLDEQKVDDAESTVKAALAATPQSVELLTALAEVQYRQGLPWDEDKTLQAAEKINLCYARLHLVFAEYYRFNSYYAAALAKIRIAHQLDPYDPDIRRAWMPTLPLKQRIEELKEYLAANDTDVDTLRHAQRQLVILENRLENRSRSCHLASPVDATEIPFTAIMVDPDHIRAWGLEVSFNDHKSRLEVDTGASGLYISRPVAERAGLKPLTKTESGGIGSKGEQSGYLSYVDSIKIGGLEFKDCLVEVSDGRSVVGTDGLIGMDVFSDFLVTLDFPWHKLTLGPLPPYPGTTAAPPALNTQQETPADQADAAATSTQDSNDPKSVPAPRGPHDRYIAPEMQHWTSVYRIGHNLIVPTALNNKRLRLFIVDTGSQGTTISPGAAREVSKVHSDPNTTVRGVSGAVANVYTVDSITFRFARLQQERNNVLSFDTSSISKNVGTEISGFIGFDLLGLLVVKIDYRDGLMSFESSADRGYQHIR